MPKGRPGGNPDLAKYHFQQKYDWDEPCTDRMQLRMPPSMKAAIKAGLIEDWQKTLLELCQIRRKDLFLYLGGYYGNRWNFH